MQDLLAGLTATLVMFLPRYGAFLAAGALLRWLIRKEQKPWYLTVALLALGKKTEDTSPTEEHAPSRPLSGEGAPQH